MSPASSSRRSATSWCCSTRPATLSPGAVATIVGGPALYLAGNALFKRLSAPYLPLSHLVGLGLLALLVPAGLYLSPLALAAGATAVLIIVVIWEWMSLRPRTAT